jgi:hypothetical protein
VAACFRALRSSLFLGSSLTICSMDRTLSGRRFLKCLKYSSSMNSDKGNFQGSWRVLVGLSERWQRLHASIHGWYSSGIFFTNQSSPIQ